MILIEFLRVRKALTIFAIVVVACTAFMDASILWGTHQPHSVTTDRHGDKTFEIGSGVQASGSGSSSGSDGDPEPRDAQMHPYPVSFAIGIAGYLAILFVSFVCSSLNRENGRGGFAFTKPISRERLALTFFAVDCAGIVAAFAIVLVVTFVSGGVLGLGGIHIRPQWDSSAGPLLALMFGAAFMWYGLLQAATASRVAGGGLFVGLAWPVFLVASSLYHLPFFGAIFHDVIAAIDFFNPLAYVASFTQRGSEGTMMQSLLGFSDGASIAITWGIGVLGCALALFSWKRLEV